MFVAIATIGKYQSIRWEWLLSRKISLLKKKMAMLKKKPRARQLMGKGEPPTGLHAKEGSHHGLLCRAADAAKGGKPRKHHLVACQESKEGTWTWPACKKA
ncbi:hypothetical protein GOP47_0025077 [Adiantum capillus-veneris]|uniref:Uncharacterized protein n=1 Tax=Adiantum capillus-veneris TaxID=13818 RepID=A0A9D4U404_ADICA|nr:hypothetical protein GOP47_0025077 [Adiantum capillus-veneris]